MYEWSGTFQWNDQGNKITLKDINVAHTPSIYLVGENTLTQLDMNGQKISSAIADSYILRKVPLELVEKYWKLIELLANPVPRDDTYRKEAHTRRKMNGEPTIISNTKRKTP